jgi:Family of unknown function (DUF5908)
MPVQIEELVVKAHVSDGKSEPQSEEQTQINAQIEEGLLKPIEHAVKEIMEILKRKNER